MNKKILDQHRVYAFDSLRAVMMFLGIVIHGVVTYGIVDYKQAWPLKAPETALIYDLIGGWVHVFRMPVFFVACGYFVALLVRKKSAIGMLKNRFQRILMPFIVAGLVIFPITMYAFAYSMMIFSGTPSPASGAWNYLLAFPISQYNPMHLWFLYFLIFFSVISYLVAITVNPQSRLFQTVSLWVASILKRPVTRVLVMALMLFICLLWCGEYMIKTNNAWKIDPATFVTYALMFATGAMIYLTDSLQYLSTHSISQLIIATLLFLVLVLVPWPEANWKLPLWQGLSALSATLYIFGFIAFFLRYFNHYSRRVSYLMDASYFVYIIHLPIVVMLQGVLGPIDLPLAIKPLMVIFVALLVSLVIYNYCVRNTFIGKFLNGKVHRVKKTATFEVNTNLAPLAVE